MKFSKKILETFINLPKDWRELMEDVGLEIKSVDGDIFNLELLANRGDHYCYFGLTKEIYGRIGSKIKYDMNKMTEKLSESKKSENLFKIETDKCLAYSLTPYKLEKPQKSRETKDNYILEILPASGVNVILDIIDVTNVVMLEYGQPAHVYDADKIKGKIHIRDSKPGEKATLLFHDGMTELPVGTCVIADDEKILCVAGVIGCHAAEADENTKNILVETALFDPVAIRKASRAIGHTSIASQIFERGGNYQAMKEGAARAKKLYEQIGWVQNGGYQIVPETMPVMVKDITLPGDFVRSELEINISDSEITERLARYGFLKSKTKNSYSVPSWRVWDIKGFKADLIEELARSIGYNNLPNRLPIATIGSQPSASELRKAEITSYLVNNGFFEVLVDNMYSPRHAKLSPVAEHISIENSVDGGYAFMRNNVIVQATELVSKNLRVKNREIRAFEWGKIFKSGNEIEILWGVMNGEKLNTLFAKGLLEGLFADLSLDVKIEYQDFEGSNKVSEWSLLNPKRRGHITCNGRGICVFGEIHPSLLAEFDIKNDAPVFFSFDTAGLMNAAKKKIKYESPSSTIPSTRDVSVTIPYGVAAGSVSNFISERYKSVADIKITDVFEKPKENVRNVTFALEFSGTKSTEELNSLILEIMNVANDFAKK
ncbi:MAG TPA: phenylalanine--tRNA ligase beta subunit-related protein [Alphaproteobacteria bacterium]|nr:phenylalanine--tRNA ligase beta subunit-related protein [Alphaproteobacteria bacterium]